MAAILIVLLTLTDLLSIILNSIVIYTFAQMRNMLTFKDYMMIGMAIGDLLQSLLGYPLEIYSSQHGKWILDVFFCKAAGFFVTFLGLVSIFYLMVLAIDLFVSVCKPFLAVDIHANVKVAFWTNFFPWSFSLFWAASPLVGWSSYALEDDHLRCSINWNGKTAADQSYIAFLFVFCYLIPLGIMFTCFCLVKRELHRMRKRVLHLSNAQSGPVLENIRAEKKHTKLALVMTVSFIVSWTPYTVVSFMASYFTRQVTVPIVLGTVAAIFAKMSTILNPVIYSYMYTRFRQNMAIPCFGKVCQRNAIQSSAHFNDARKSTSMVDTTAGMEVSESRV